MIANLPNRQPTAWQQRSHAREPSLTQRNTAKTRYTTVGLILMLALLCFELFNFDTTQYALSDLMGDVRFAGVQWATILAIAFCGIDFAGLLRVFTPDDTESTPPEVWYLMAAWLLGATMNAVMTWYAVSLTLVEHHVGNEILSEGQLVRAVPIFVAVLVWLTRILFIGSLSMAGNRMVDYAFRPKLLQPNQPQPIHNPNRATVRAAPADYRSQRPEPLFDGELLDEEPTIAQFVPPSQPQTVRRTRR